MIPMGMPIASVLYAFQTSGFSGKAIVVILFVGSIFVWSIMLTKLRELHHAQEESHRFLLYYRKEGHPVSLFLKRQKYPGSPLFAVYDQTCRALGVELGAQGSDTEDLFLGGIGVEDRILAGSQLNAVRHVTEQRVADRALQLEQSMGFLATATSTAPFLGLLGTVWGVMDAFVGMAVHGSVMLSAVAPGIAGALLTTVVGLLVALPSAIGYNIMNDRIRRLVVQMDGFSQELLSDIERHYLKA